MDLEDYRTVFAVGSLILMLVGASPILSVVIPVSQSGERFSELWVLGPTHVAENYPFNVSIGEEQRVFVGVGNHMGRSAYYLVYVKFRNQTQEGPDSASFSQSPLAPLYEFRFVIADGEKWEQHVFFSIIKASNNESLSNISELLIDNSAFEVNYLATWDSVNRGFYYQLFFELWMYDESVSNFQYQNHFVGLWLNITV